MRKLYFSIVFIAITISLISLSNIITETKVPAIQSKSSTSCSNSDLSKASSADACSGCHGGTVDNGYVIIIYENGKLNSNVSILSGESNLYLYNETNNTSYVAQQIQDQGVEVTMNNSTENTIDVNKFTSIHGANSSMILKNLAYLKTVSAENKTININASPINNEFTTLFNNNSMQLNISSTANSYIQVSLFDLSGKSYLMNSKSEVNKGENQLNFETKTLLNRGIYIVKIIDEFGLITTKKIVIN